MKFRHLSQKWQDSEFMADEEFCQNEPANFLDRMDVLNLWDLVGTTHPDFQRFIVRKAYLKASKIETNFEMHFSLCLMELVPVPIMT